MKFESITELEVLKYAYDGILERWSYWKQRSEEYPESEYAKKNETFV